MKKIFTLCVNLMPCLAMMLLWSARIQAQDCSGLTASATTIESRCTATGVITVSASGGSGNFNYRVVGPTTTTFTSANVLTGLSAGTYVVTVRDILSGCTFDITNVVIAGSYSDPRFSLVKTDVSCLNEADGSIAVAGLENGRAPFTFTIMAPSPSQVGNSNNTGSFSNLVGGEYVIQLRDSCGGMQTRRITVLSYDWSINNHTITPVACDSADVSVTLGDIKGNTNTSGSAFSSYSYGIVKTPGDTIWTTNRNFRFYLGNTRTVQLVVRDGCGNVKVMSWTNPNRPAVAPAISSSALACSTFTATVTGQVNLTNPQYCLYNSSNVLISCNTTGVFTNVPYGPYSIRVTDVCYDTVITRNFTVTHVIPSVAANVTISNRACATFSATVTGQTNLTSPTYRLYDIANNLLQTNATGAFTNLAYGSYCVRITDGCYDTTISRCFSSTPPIPALGATPAISARTCSTFTVTVNGQANLVNPQYRLFDLNNNLIAQNTNGIFTMVPNGSYCIRVQNDACYDTTITRCISVTAPVPTVAPGVGISAATCNSFTAGISGQTNLTNPQYCLYDANNVLIGCNTTGLFSGLAYGNYCIRIVNDPCYDTTIVRCFTANQPTPSLGASVNITNRTCSTFAANITGATNITNAVYTLLDANNVVVGTNSTGSFTNIPYGAYCIRMQNDACFDTTITRCFSSTPPVPSAGAAVTISARTCSTVTAQLTSLTNLTSPQYFLYDGSNNLVATSSNGTFTNVPYGSYCARIVNSCYDTTITRCFVAARLVPSVGATVGISNRLCTTFTATISGQTNLNNPQYRLYDNANNLVATSSNGVFNNVAYGSYCIQIQDPCYDTIMTRCFTSSPTPISVALTAQQACTLGTTDVRVVFTGTGTPYQIRVYDPQNNLVRDISTSTATTWVNSLPGLSGGQQYKIVGQNNCGVRDSQFVTPVAGVLNRVSSVTSKCPTAEWQNGATDMAITATSNLGSVTPTIIRKNGVPVTINYTTLISGVYRFIDLEPATYVMAYNIQNCTGQVLDTIQVAPYTYPGLQQSAAYQCDNNSFSVGAALSGGSAPYTYEVIGSMPASPSIVSAAQGSPVFNIDNGTVYNLVRLRAIDACGNATLNDVNILPLANIIVSASSNCFYNDINLSVDTIPNATYQWFRKTSETDSVLVGSSINYTIPYLLPSDTGVYVCKTSVNSGCLTKLAVFRVDGACGTILSSGAILSGKQANKSNLLNWKAVAGDETKQYVIESSATRDGNFREIGRVSARGENAQYQFMDNNPVGSTTYYRLKLVNGTKSSYSNVVIIKQAASQSINIYPNPVRQVINVTLAAGSVQSYRLSLYTVSGQLVKEMVQQNVTNTTVRITRDSHLKAGVYLLRVVNTVNGEVSSHRLVFE